jgi:hypothetical protein
MVKPNNAQLHWSLTVTCPTCDHSTDLSNPDDDYIVAKAIFNNAWDDLKGYEVTCANCKTEFTVDQVEY